MIDPNSITKFDRTEEELEEFLLFSVVVAGKTASQQVKKLELFLLLLAVDYLMSRTVLPTNVRTVGPFALLRFAEHEGILESTLRDAKLGQYTRLAKTFRHLAFANFDLSTVTVEQLEQVPGIGPKTARLFILHSRPNQKLAVLDTHILKWMRNEGWTTIRTTPTGPTYRALEVRLVEHLEQNSLDAADFDLMTWRSYANQTSSVENVSTN